MVEEIFLPLNQAQCSAQPAPGEWSEDQCFQHLVLVYEFLVPKFITALDIPEPPDADGIFRPSLLARYFSIPAGWSQLFRNEVDWAFESEPQTLAGGRRIFVPWGKMLGSSSNHAIRATWTSERGRGDDRGTRLALDRRRCDKIGNPRSRRR